MIADVPAGFAFLDSLASDIQLPLLYSSHAFATSGDMQNDIAFRNENMDIPADVRLETLRAMARIDSNRAAKLTTLAEDPNARIRTAVAKVSAHGYSRK